MQLRRCHRDEIAGIYGMVNGIEGFLEGKVLDFEKELPGERLDGLLTTPGAYLGSCRYKLPEDLEDPVYQKLFEKFEELGIGYILYIGGNDSMDTVSKLSRYGKKIGSSAAILGEPKTMGQRSCTYRPYAGIWERCEICGFYRSGDCHGCQRI
ncbi:MAG: 6-phosphofructokinase [[Clostridium] scindens]